MAKTDTPPADFHAHYRYDPATGLFHHTTRKQARGGIKLPGDTAGTLKDGYIMLKIAGTIYRAHRIAWWVMTGDWLPAKQDIDHINGRRDDNRWENLRLATRAQNNVNTTAPRSDNKSGHRGVSWRADTRKWHARITVGGRVILLGDYDRLEDAAAARAAAERQHYGAHSPLSR